ncbi:MAG: hypothetical protein ABW168_18965 [Sedimenticola sp.]
MTSRFLEALDAGATRLEDLLCLFPSLSSSTILDNLSEWHQQKMKIRMEQKGTEDDRSIYDEQRIRELTIELLGENSIEDTLDILFSKYKAAITPEELVHMIGLNLYLSELRRDAGALVTNAVSYNQIATLWNDLGRPALGGHPKWSGRNVSILIK